MCMAIVCWWVYVCVRTSLSVYVVGWSWQIMTEYLYPTTVTEGLNALGHNVRAQRLVSLVPAPR
jgi:hypothetical protein